MKAQGDRVWSPARPGWAAVFLSAMLLGSGLGAAEDSLGEIALFSASVGEWKGIGVSFDIRNGELQDPVTFRDRWEAALKEEGQLMEMRGATQAGGRRIGYLWRFRWQPQAGKITGEFENSEGVASTVEVEVVAEGKRIEIRTPKSEEDAGAMSMDIFLEDEDIVIESSIVDSRGNQIFRAAARYRKND